MTDPVPPRAGAEDDGQQHQPLWRKVLLLGVPALLVAWFVAATVWGAVSFHYGERVARERATEVEAVARSRGLTATDVKADLAGGVPSELAQALEVPGTELEAVAGGDGAGDAQAVLRSTAWGGLSCIRLHIGIDGDISSDQGRC